MKCGGDVWDIPPKEQPVKKPAANKLRDPKTEMKDKPPCRYCNGNGFFYSDPDLGPCACVDLEDKQA